MLIALYPTFQTTIDAQLEQSLTQIPDGADKAEGVVIGKAVADAMLGLRSDDNSLRSTTQDTDRIKPVESVAGASFSTFQILKATVANLRVADRPFEWNYTLEAPNYAKTAGDLLLVRPRVLGSKSSGLLETKEARQYPDRNRGPDAALHAYLRDQRPQRAGQRGGKLREFYRVIADDERNSAVLKRVSQ